MAFTLHHFSPNKRYKPTIWTEAWTGWFENFGGPIQHRPVEDLAFAIARFVQKGGSFLNYYMYHGGTNFERATGGPLITTSYDYDAPIDEYGLIRQPKYDHLKELLKAIKLCEHALVSADPNFTPLGNYEQDDSQLVRSCIVGQIYDSGPVDFTSDLGPRFNLHLSVFKMPGSAMLVSPVVIGVSSRLDTSFITRFGSQRTDYWQSLYSSVSLGAPFLILFSNFDDLAPYPIICKFSRRIQDAGGAEIGAYEQRLWKKGHFG